MNITFLIGNGFDLNLGLPTDYSSFLKYHKDKDQNDMISKAIREDYEAWSDVESALGAFTKNVNPDSLNEFVESKCLLDESLSDYLEQINDSYTLEIDNAGAVEFRDKLIGLSKEMCVRDREHYSSLIERAGEVNKYGFITFNYTDYLDKIVYTARSKISPFFTRRIGTSSYSDAILDPIHIHGRLGENVLLGVNDNAQIAASDEIKQEIGALLIKPDMNASLGEQRTEQARDLINSSRFVLVYGMSLGMTDSMWWEMLTKWLKAGSERRLILYVYSPKINNKSATRSLIFQNDKRKEFLKAAKCNDSGILKQIIVVPNTKVFTYKNILIKNKQVDERAEAV